MSAGHYTAFVKNNEVWHLYDDANSYPIDKESIQTKIANAYILFYIRKLFLFVNNRDVIPGDPKETLRTIMRDLEVPFEGKPVKTKFGVSGYIKEMRKNQHCKYMVKCFKTDASFYLR